MAVMAPSVFVRERVSRRRRPVVTGSFTGTGPGADADGIVCAADVMQAARNRTTGIDFTGGPPQASLRINQWRLDRHSWPMIGGSVLRGSEPNAPFGRVRSLRAGSVDSRGSPRSFTAQRTLVQDDNPTGPPLYDPYL